MNLTGNYQTVLWLRVIDCMTTQDGDTGLLRLGMATHQNLIQHCQG